jgi:putative phosphoesterase
LQAISTGFEEPPMRIGIFADAHDHVDNVRHAVAFFNQQACELVLFAGDFVSPLVIPPLRQLTGKFIACFGDNDGNQRGIIGGMRVIGPIGPGPVCVKAKDGTRILMTHVLNDIRSCLGDAQLIVFAHTHRPSIVKDAQGRLFVNPGETGGWSTRKPTVALVETTELEGQIVALPELPPFAT